MKKIIHILDHEIYFDDNEIKLCYVTEWSCLIFFLQKNFLNSMSDTN